jgi:isocitrate/isopropylmalate dehydrogenase
MLLNFTLNLKHFADSNPTWVLIFRYVFDSSLKEAEKLKSIHKSDVVNVQNLFATIIAEV